MACDPVVLVVGFDIRYGPRAAVGNRTRDLLITNEVLYQLSYSSEDERPSRPNSALKMLRGADLRGQSGRRDLNPQHFAWKELSPDYPFGSLAIVGFG